MDNLIIVRQGPAWNISALAIADQRLILDEFHRHARQQGSQAVWLGEAGEVVTTDPAEAALAFPYEMWALEAYRQMRAAWEQDSFWEKAGDLVPPPNRLH